MALAVDDIPVKEFQLPLISNKTLCISFKSGCVVRVAKHLKETGS